MARFSMFSYLTECVSVDAPDLLTCTVKVLTFSGSGLLPCVGNPILTVWNIYKNIITIDKDLAPSLHVFEHLEI